MTDSKNLQPLWDQLVGEDLSGIVFVRDYMQLQFNPPPQLNIYSSHVVVSAEGRCAKFREEAFANLALGLIGKFVREVRVDEQSFHIVFADKSEIMISLRPEHYQGPEAVDFQGRDNQWAVL
jgi:hypothetical protein